MSGQSSQNPSNPASKDASSIGNGVTSTGGPTPSGSQQTEWVRRATNGISSSNTSVNNSTSNQSGPRRPSLSTTLTHHPREYPSSATVAASVSGLPTPSSTSAYQPSVRDASQPYRYSKDYMLHKYDTLEANGTLSDNSRVNKLLIGESEKEGLFGGGSKDRNGNGTEACWDSSGQQRPVSYEPMTNDEKELFQSVNSVQKPHQTPNTPGGPNSTSVPPGQGNQPRNSTSATNLNSTYHKSSVSVSSTGAVAPTGTASPTARVRPRRDTGDNPLVRRRTDRGDDNSNPFDRFSNRQPPGDDKRDDDDSTPGGRGSAFKRQPSGGPWAVASPVTPGGSAYSSAFSNGTFGGVAGFSLNSGVPVVAKNESEKKFGGSVGRSTGRSLVGDPVEEENEDAEDAPKNDSKPSEDREGSSLQELSRESEADQDFGRDGYGRRSDSAETDPYNPRKSVQASDLDIENPLEERLRSSHSQLEQDSFYNGPQSGTIGRNMMSSPTRNIPGSAGGSIFAGGMGARGSGVGSPSSSRQGQHTPLSGFHSLQTQAVGPLSGFPEQENPSPSSTNPYQSPVPENEEDNTGEVNSLRNFRPPGGSDRSQTSSAGIIGGGLPFPGTFGGTFSNALGTPGLWSNPMSQGGIGSGLPSAGGVAGSFFGAGDSGVGTPSGAPGSAFGPTRASRLGQLFPAEQQQQLHNLQEQQRQQSRLMFDEEGPFDPADALRSLSMNERQPRRDNRNSADSAFGSSARQSMGTDNPYFATDPEGHAAHTVQPRGSFPALSHSNSVSSLHQFPPGVPQPPGTGTAPGSQRNSNGHIMIMPDKITWVYKDPSGKIQGPFTGLEMHDWYKAGFFQQDLHIKRQDLEGDFEPLGTFVRRVGNSREPFLIPMQGPSFPPGNGWTAPSPWGQNTIDAANGIVQPPFPGSFPTFGTTLTADQQNALERRKQEEQYLMARQREYLVQQQVLAKQQNIQHMSKMSQESLQHHPSQASLHSQPSLTNVQSPGPFQQPFGDLRHTTSNPLLDGMHPSREDFGAAFPGPIQTPQGFGGPTPPQQPQQTTREQAQALERQRAQMARTFTSQHQLLDRQQQQRAALLQQAQGLPRDQQQQQQQQGNQGQGHQAGPPQNMPPYQVAAGDDAIDITQDVGFDNDARDDMNDTAAAAAISIADEYELFQQQHQLQIQQLDEDLRNQHYEHSSLSYFPGDIDYTNAISSLNMPFNTNNETHETIITTTSTTAGPGPHQPGTLTDEANTNDPSVADEFLNDDDERKHVSEFEAPSPITSTAIPEPPKNPWGTVSQSAMPLPFPPAPKSITSPRPSTAQSVSRSPTLSASEPQTVPIAPWAKDLESAPHQKGPSLKEIQENQAKQVAKAEAAAQEARRQEQAQQAALAAATAPAPPTSGLPSTSTWGAPTPPATTNAIAWAKPLAKATTASQKQKTLAQIQKEEEARKQKAMAQQVVQPPTAPSPALTPATTAAPGRRSEWATKAAAAPSAPTISTSSVGGAWTTVGAGGKKVGGTTPVTAAPQPIKTTAAPKPAVVKKPSAPVQSAVPTVQKTANDEFMKWCKINLKGLNSGVNVDDFLNMIMSFPLEIDLISDSVYQQSTTIDGRRFAEEFIRRRKLAQQGVVVDHGHHGDDSKSGGGWSEVAKKGRDSTTAAAPVVTGAVDAGLGNGSFKVVQGKKKRR